jgi:hypothetical protein
MLSDADVSELTARLRSPHVVAFPGADHGLHGGRTEAVLSAIETFLIDQTKPD